MGNPWCCNHLIALDCSSAFYLEMEPPIGLVCVSKDSLVDQGRGKSCITLNEVSNRWTAVLKVRSCIDLMLLTLDTTILAKRFSLDKSSIS